MKVGGNSIIQEAYCDGDRTEAQKAFILEHPWEAEIDSLLGVSHNKTFSKEKITNIVTNIGLKEVGIFESTHSVNCLFCKRKYECEDPKNQTAMHDAIKEIDDAIRRLENYPDLENRNRLKEEGERLEERMAEFGSSSASYLFFIGKA